MTLKKESRKPKKNEHLQQIRLQVEKDWQYWRPIAFGLVKIDKADYDREGPLFSMKLNAAMNYRAKLERDAMNNAKEGQENEW